MSPSYAATRLLELEERHEKTLFEIGGVLSAIVPPAVSGTPD